MRYPDAKRLDLVDDLHGHQVPDPYRWLEAVGEAECEAWSAAQDALCRGYLDSLPGRDHLGRRLRDLLPGVVSPPAVRGDRRFFSRRQPEQDHAVLYVREPDGQERPLIDPNTLSEDKTTTLDAAAVSWEGDRIAYLLSHHGTEQSVLHVLDVASGDDVAAPVLLGRGGDLAWLPGGEELFVVRRLPDDQIPDGEEQFHRRVWRHRVGADPAGDELVFGEERDKTTYYGIKTSVDGRWLLVSAALGTAPRNDLYLLDIAAGTWRTIQEGVDALTYGGVAHDGRLYVMTNRDAPKWRLCVADPEGVTADGDWAELLPETDDVLTGYTVTKDAVVGVRTHDVVSVVSVHDIATGRHRADISLPGLGVATVTSSPVGGDDVWIGYTDFVTPYRVLQYTISSATLTTWAEPPGAITPEGITARQVFYESRDGTRIPMFVIARDDVDPDGKRSTILYGYGGFNVPLDPAYSSGIAAWVEQGGVYAIANLRGGSEYGEEWHRAGMRANKQNVFDDFLAAADWLIDNQWTSPKRLAVSGGSNGGLLVGAALTQAPDKFRAVVCSAPLLDMIRYELFGLGQTWNDEYGRADDAHEFGWLLSYSPYHRVREGTAYPAVLFTVFEGDTRVDPLHARKMCAALQHATSSDPDERPVLIRRETKVGHGARAVTRQIELNVDTMSFLAAQLGLDLPE